MSTEIPDGLGATLSFATSGFSMRNTTVNLPAIEGGDPIPMTGLDNTQFRTQALKTLLSYEEYTVEGFFNEEDYSETDHVNVEQSITHTLPDGSTLQLYGGIRRIEPGEFVEGEAVKCTVTIVPTLRDPDSGEETAPVWTQA